MGWLVGLPIVDPVSINDPVSMESVRSVNPDLLVVCDYGQILSKEALSAARLGGINLHGSILPRHRGAAPVQWSILAGDQVSGASVIHMTPKLDGGPVLASFRRQSASMKMLKSWSIALVCLGWT